MNRSDGRMPDELRKVKITRNCMKWAEGSALIEVGSTRVICTASVEDRVPMFLKGTGQGWVTAEYGMLPRSTRERTIREVSKGRAAGRTYEIQRLVGRALRSVTDLPALSERTVWIDCDVIQADGGTRTASITGSFVALADALNGLFPDSGDGKIFPLRDFLAATSVGVMAGGEYLDLAFEEDSRAQVDMNLVMTGRGRIVEIQGTAEGEPFSKTQLDRLMNLAKKGIDELITIQQEVLGDVARRIGVREPGRQ